MHTNLLRATRVRSAFVVITVMSLGVIALGPMAPASGALPDIDEPELALNHILRTNPFAGSSVSAKDNEGSAYVARDNSLWMGDDDGRAIYEVNPSTGQLKRSITRAALEATPRFGGGPVAGSNRDRDIESLAYDSATDTLYVFSGSCCSSTVLSTVFRFTRQGGTLQFVFDIVGAPSEPTAPTAAFTASTTSGTAPLTVSFNDTSTGNPTSWQWNFGDGQSSTARNPSHVFANTGGYTVTLTASNANGSSSASRQITVSDVPPPPPPGDNLIGNAGFEQNTAGWDTGGYAAVTLARVAGGHSGASAAKITNTGTTTVTSTLNDAPNWVQTTSAGTYTGSIWVRADTAGAKLYLRVREFRGSTKLGEQLAGVVLSTQWQKVSASLASVSPGTSTIDFSAAVYSSARASVYYADDASLTRN